MHVHAGWHSFLHIKSSHWVLEEKRFCARKSRENPIETIMNDKMANKQPSSAETMKQAIKDVCVTEITQV